MQQLEGREVPATIAVTNGNTVGPGSLDAAITAANNTAGADIIDIQTKDPITLTHIISFIGSEVTINVAAGASPIVARSDAPGTPNFPVLRVMGASAKVTMNDLIIRNGKADITAAGGGIDNSGTLTLVGCTIIDNHAPGAAGGGIYNATGATLTLKEECKIKKNDAKMGGGIWNSGTLTTDSTNNLVFNNDAADQGGGIYNNGSATFNFSSFIWGNHAEYGGGAFNTAGGSFTMTKGSALLQNIAFSQGGGIYSTDGTVSMTDMKIHGNSALVEGGGYYIAGGTATFTRCDFQGNWSSGKGPGGWSKQGTTTRNNCTGQLAADFFDQG